MTDNTTSPPLSEEAGNDDRWRTLAEFRVPSEPGNERLAMELIMYLEGDENGSENA